MKTQIFLRVSVIAVCLFSSVVSASVPGDVEDLVGKRARNADPALQRHGYVHIETQKSGNHTSYGHWWSYSRKQCLEVQYGHGKVRSIRDVSTYDCNQRPHHLEHEDSDTAKSAAIAVGAAALIGAIAIAHKSNHHDEGNHYDDNNYELEFERGHRDALHNHSYDNYNETRAYTNGYDSGVEQRTHDTSYRQHSGRYDRGYGRQVEFSDLEGARASSADSALSDRGFRNVDGFKETATAYTIWYNRFSGQCLQMTVAGGRVVDLSDIRSHPGCR